MIEPDSLANLVTNLNVAKCANAQSAYLECTNYAVTQLNLPNVAMYLDAGIYTIPPSFLVSFSLSRRF
jgi:cellulose 1,4-beta-cellobiosidase